MQIGLDAYVALTGDRSATTVALWLTSGADLASVRDAVRRDLPGGDRLELATPGEIRALSLAAFDRTFAVTYALEFAGVAIGLVGLSSAFGALVLARRREFGVLRHLGMTKRQVGAMLATEGFVTSGLGVAAGLALGFGISLILIYVVNRQSFHWGMEISVPSARARDVRGRGHRARNADRGRKRPQRNGRRCRARGEGGLVRRRTFLGAPLLLGDAGSAAARRTRRWFTDDRSHSRAIMAAIRSFATSGGTSPASCATRTGASSACR